MSAILRASATTILEPVESALEVRLIRAVNDLRRGHPVILVDDFDRENEADLVVAAERISIAAMQETRTGFIQIIRGDKTELRWPRWCEPLPK